MAMGILEMPETVTKTDLTNIIAFLCKQLDWIMSDKEENLKLSTKSLTKRMVSENVNENVLNITIKTPEKQNDESMIGKKLDCVKEEIKSKSEDMNMDNYFDILFEGTHKEILSDNEDIQNIENENGMVIEEHKSEWPTMLSEDILKEPGSHNTQNTENMTPTEHCKSMINKSEPDDGESLSKDEQSFNVRKLSSRVGDTPTMSSNDPTTGNRTDPLQLPTKAKRKVVVPLGEKSIVPDAAKTMIEVQATFFSCLTCKANFGHRIGLENHIKWSSNKDGSMRCRKEMAKPDPNRPKGRNCNLCDKAFQSKKGLDAHVETIHKKVKHDCPQCGKSFTQTTALKRHQQTVHTKINSLHCPTCGERFSQKFSLTRHISEAHQGGKSYDCNQCEKKFNRAENLRRHVAINHEGVPRMRAYSCPLCQKLFGLASHRNRHVRNVHKVHCIP